MITKDRALEVLSSLDTIAFPALDEPSLYYEELERYILGDDAISVGQEGGNDLVAKLAETASLLSSTHKRVTEEGTLLHSVKGLDWPAVAVCVVQDKDGEIKWLPSMPCGSECYGGSSTFPDRCGDWWFILDDGNIACYGEYAVCHLEAQTLTSDWSSSIVTKEMWEAVQ